MAVVVVVMMMSVSLSLSTAPLCYTAQLQAHRKRKRLSWLGGWLAIISRVDAIHAIIKLHYTRARKGQRWLCCAGPNLISHAGSVAALYHPDI